MKEFGQVSAIHNLLVAEVPNSSSPPCVNAFMDKLLQSLLHKNLAALKSVCNSLDCNPVHEGRLSKYNYAEMLVAWVSCLVIHYPSISHLHIQCQDMLLSVMPQLDTDLDAHKVLQCIHAVICDASTPSWLGPVPASFGDAAAGTIKADKWCSLIMVYIPITLISLWGSSQVEKHLKDKLNHTMLLVSIVYLSCVRTMSSAHTKAYQLCITEYIGALEQIHPGFNP